MSRSTFQIQGQGPKIKVSIGGAIDEDTDFSKTDISAAQDIELHLANIKSINSCGIRDWMKWISTAPGAVFTFTECPKVIVDQINMVQGFLPATGKVQSFYVPYYSEESEQEKNVLFNFGKEFTDQGLVGAPEVKDSTGAEMEMDVVESKYFKFLQKK